MNCPFCRNPETKVIDTRENDNGTSIRRRRQCTKCGKRFTTIESTQLFVLKNNGDVEPFSRDKVINGVRKACQGRPIADDELKQLGRRVEEDLRSSGKAEVRSQEIGTAILQPLRELDEVAYMRFASVYRNFANLGDFENAIAELREYQESKKRTSEE